MNYQIRFYLEAVEEVDAAVQWYALRSERIAERFLDELSHTFDLIVRNPQLFPVFHKGTRKAILRHFPYFAVFRIAPDCIQVIAVAHAKRRPNYWRNR